MISGQTNVRSQRFGRGAVHGLGRELGRFVVASMSVPWQIVEPLIGARPAAVVMVESMELEFIERQAAKLPACDTILAVGGGQAIDLGKFFAWKLGCRLVTVPTIVSVNAFVTPKAAVRRNHQVEYVGHATPDPLVIDYDLLRTAPAELNVAGVGDILSIHTATRDWEIAHAAGRDTHRFSADDVRRARQIVTDTAAAADEIAAQTDVGLQAIVDAYLRINTICLSADHYRTEEGSEHFVFYELEERLKRSFVHGQIVGLGIYLMSRLQANDPVGMTRVMDRLQLGYHPADMQIARADLEASLRNLGQYVVERNHWYSVINERKISEEWIAESLAGLRFVG